MESIIGTILEKRDEICKDVLNSNSPDHVAMFKNSMYAFDNLFYSYVHLGSDKASAFVTFASLTRAKCLTENKCFNKIIGFMSWGTGFLHLEFTSIQGLKLDFEYM